MSLVVQPTVNKTAEILRWLSEEPGQANMFVFPESGKIPFPVSKVGKWLLGRGAEMLGEPLRRNPRHLFERARFFEEVRRPRDNH